MKHRETMKIDEVKAGRSRTGCRLIEGNCHVIIRNVSSEFSGAGDVQGGRGPWPSEPAQPASWKRSKMPLKKMLVRTSAKVFPLVRLHFSFPELDFLPKCQKPIASVLYLCFL